MPPKIHQFYAVAFEENFPLKQLAQVFPEAKISMHELTVRLDQEGGMIVYPFGTAVLYDASAERRQRELARLHDWAPKLTTQIIREDYSVIEDPTFKTGIVDGTLHVDKFTPGRAAIVALTVAQSAAMEYYERIVDDLFGRTNSLVVRLQRRGTVPFRTRPLHRFIGDAIGTRTEVLSVLHLLDKPDATWEDAAMDQIYVDLRGEFDLVDRYAALESKLRSIQETLELVLDVARERRLLLLEVAVALLILLEVVLSLPGASDRVHQIVRLATFAF